MTTRHKKFISWFASLALLSLLAACGGADGDAARSLPFTSAAALRASAPPASLPGTESRSRPLGVTATIDVESLLNWAESSYPLLFPRGPATQRMRADGVNYTLRHYPATGNYVGMADDGSVWGYGPFTGNSLKSYGQMSDYTCLVSPRLCDQVPVVCKTEITTGFSGDLNATYIVPDNGGDGASGDGGGGSAGAGGSEGKVLGGRIKVIRLSDGVELGEGVTDSTLGLTTIKWCKQDMPVMLELRGAPGAKYFDEAVNDLVDFPITQKLRALVDKFDENVGISSLTEAAYVYALNNLTSDPTPVKAGTLPIKQDGVPIGLTSSQIAKANSVVLGEFNRRLDASQSLPSVKSLATPVGKSSSSSAFPANRFGNIAALHGGISKVSKSYAHSSKSPALDNAKQLALDLSDGIIDDYKLDRKLVAKSTADATYDAKRLSQDLAGGIGVTSLQFGATTTLSNGPNYLKSRMAYGLFEGKHFFYYLSKARTVVEFNVEWNTFKTDFNVGFLGDAVDITEFSNAPVYALTSDGSVFGWGNVSCGALGNGDASSYFQRSPQRISIDKRIRQIISGQAYEVAVALADDGSVYSWGNASPSGLIGFELKSTLLPNQSKCVDSNHFPSSAITKPTQIDSLSSIRFLRHNGDAAFAIDYAGNIFRWGNSQTGLADPGYFVRTTPTLIATMPGVKDVVGYHWRFNAGPIDSQRFHVFAIDHEGQINLLGPTFDPVVGKPTNAELALILKTIDTRYRTGVFTKIPNLMPATALLSDDSMVLSLGADGIVTLIAYNEEMLSRLAMFPTYSDSAGPGQRRKVSDTPPMFVRLATLSFPGQTSIAAAIGNDGKAYAVECTGASSNSASCIWVIKDLSSNGNTKLPVPY